MLKAFFLYWLLTSHPHHEKVNAPVDPIILNPKLGVGCTLFVRDSAGKTLHSAPTDCYYMPEHGEGDCTLTIESGPWRQFFKAPTKCPTAGQ